jgi:hypothetical protein
MKRAQLSSRGRGQSLNQMRSVRLGDEISRWPLKYPPTPPPRTERFVGPCVGSRPLEPLNTCPSTPQPREKERDHPRCVCVCGVCDCECERVSVSCFHTVHGCMLLSSMNEAGTHANGENICFTSSQFYCWNKDSKEHQSFFAVFFGYLPSLSR